jgi:hypothetical protein
MRTVIAIAAATAILAAPAVAQSTWQEYTYPDQQFAVSFPGTPNVSTKPFTAANGTQVTQTLYSVQQGTGLFKVAVVDFSNTGLDRTTAIDQAISALREKGDVKLDIPARVQRNIGRYVNLASNDGSHTIAAVFFGNNRLYEIEGTVPASNPDALSGEMIRFQQSIRFMGDAAGARGATFARGQFQGRGRRFRQPPPGQQNPPQPQSNPGQ